MKAILSILFVSLCLIISGADTCNSDNHKAPVRVHPQQDWKNFNKYISTVQLPDHLEFCGERVPLEIDEVRERVEREFYLLLQKPGQIMLYIKRAGRLFPMYDRIIKEHNMPPDLKYLSVAESALYMSRSTAGAVGLWQFIPATGRKMGLIYSKNVDERRNPERSTHAAMEYLAQGYKTQKSWLLTAAGYNMGPGRVSRHLAHQNADDYWDLFMNEETSRYILRIVIIKEIMDNPRRYGFIYDEDDLYKPYKTKTIEVKSAISDLADWAEKHGTTYKYVRLYNPWMRQKHLNRPPKSRPWKILVPEVHPESED